MPTERPRFRACGRSLRSKFAIEVCEELAAQQLLHIKSEYVTDYVSYTEMRVQALRGRVTVRAVLLLGPCRRELRTGTVARTSALGRLGTTLVVQVRGALHLLNRIIAIRHPRCPNLTICSFYIHVE